MVKENKNQSVEKTAQVFIERPKRAVINVKIKGTAPLIMQRPNPEVVKSITDKQTGKGAKSKKIRNLDNECDACYHRLPGKKDVYGFPASGFMGAIMFIAKDPKLEGLAGTDIQRHLQVKPPKGNLIPIEYQEIERVDDIVIRNRTTPDTARRPYFYGWSATVPLEYNPDVFSPDMVVTIMAIAGISGGIGAWRPSAKKPGPNGTWEIVGGEN